MWGYLEGLDVVEFDARGVGGRRRVPEPVGVAWSSVLREAGAVARNEGLSQPGLTAGHFRDVSMSISLAFSILYPKRNRRGWLRGQFLVADGQESVSHYGILEDLGLVTAQDGVVVPRFPRGVVETADTSAEAFSLPVAGLLVDIIWCRSASSSNHLALAAIRNYSAYL